MTKAGPNGINAGINGIKTGLKAIKAGLDGLNPHINLVTLSICFFRISAHQHFEEIDQIN